MRSLMKLNENLFTRPLIFSCVEVECRADNSYQFNYLTIKRVNNKIKIIDKEKEIDSFAELKKHLKKDEPIAIAITGKGVLIKKIDDLKQQDDIDYLKYVLPNATLNDFILQSLSNERGAVFCAVARRDDVEKVSGLFKSNGLFVVSTSLGVLHLSCAIKLLELTHNRMNLGDYKIQIRNDQIVDISQNKFRKQDESYRIGNEDIDQKLITAFAVGFQYFILNQKNNESSKSYSEEVEFNLFKRFKTVKLAFLISCFVVLLVNFFLFDHYGKQTNKLNIELSSFDKLLSKHDLLKEELNSKQEIVNSLGLEQKLKFSFIADQIGSSVVNQITLSELSVYPIKSNRNKELEFIKDKVLITGKVKSADELNKWVNVVREFHWINNLTITDFAFVDKDNSAKFEIELIISNSFL